MTTVLLILLFQTAKLHFYPEYYKIHRKLTDMLKQIPETELILNKDGSIYHLMLKPENIANNILLVGDPGRVNEVKKHFQKIEFEIQNREFKTCTGFYKKKRITVLSTGIGTDNIDIVLNELDALVNIDLKKRVVKKKLTKLNLVRIGTCGALQKNIKVDSFVTSKWGLGLDNLMIYYGWLYKKRTPQNELAFAMFNQTKSISSLNWYWAESSQKLLKKIGRGMASGVTATAPGFYAPQGRKLRLNPACENINEMLSAFSVKHPSTGEMLRITNFEMETSALYGLSALMGHHALTVCLVVGNRITKTFSKDYHPRMQVLIKTVLDRI